MNLSDIIDQNVNSLSHLFHDRQQVIKRIKICSTCNGEGFTEVFTHQGHSRGHAIEDQVCGTCSGTGRLDLEITIRINPHKPKHHEVSNG